MNETAASRQYKQQSGTYDKPKNGLSVCHSCSFSMLLCCSRCQRSLCVHTLSLTFAMNLLYNLSISFAITPFFSRRHQFTLVIFARNSFLSFSSIVKTVRATSSVQKQK